MSEKVVEKSHADPEVQVKETADEAELAKLGYKQELKRDLTLIQVSVGGLPV
jgi:hypothetical protein